MVSRPFCLTSKKVRTLSTVHGSYFLPPSPQHFLLLLQAWLQCSGNVGCSSTPGSFQGLTSLRKLWLMHAQVATIERNAFDDLKSLEELNLSHNNLMSLPHDLFTPLHRLERATREKPRGSHRLAR